MILADEIKRHYHYGRTASVRIGHFTLNIQSKEVMIVHITISSLMSTDAILYCNQSFIWYSTLSLSIQSFSYTLQYFHELIVMFETILFFKLINIEYAEVRKVIPPTHENEVDNADVHGLYERNETL